MGDRTRYRSHSIPNFGGYTTTSPIFYSIPWNPTDYSASGLGPGQSAMHDYRSHLNGSLDYSKSGFTYFNNNSCTCGFLSEYRKQYNQRRTLQSARPTKPWWNGREMTSKLQNNIDPKFPCYAMHIESTYAKDYRGSRGEPANLCSPEGEIERAARLLGRDFWCPSPSRVMS